MHVLQNEELSVAEIQEILGMGQSRISTHLAQLKRAGLVQDLAVGVDPDGADAWAWQDLLAEGVRMGAPADEFNTQGQDWGMPPFDPHRLRAAGYRPWVETIRAAMGHASGLRIDHVLGLFRLWWIPAQAAAADGAYVRYRHHELLDSEKENPGRDEANHGCAGTGSGTTP